MVTMNPQDELGDHEADDLLIRSVPQLLPFPASIPVFMDALQFPDP